MNNGSSNGGNTMGGQRASGMEGIKEKAKVLVDQSHEKVDQLKHRVMSAKDTAVSRGNVYMDRATTFIRANPLKAVGIAFGIGYLGMRLIRR